ncbi:PREDICTED: leucine-rich repeat-containing protein 15-like [Branchiostoma belcheri]|uniref:Leucine-rich repeat-containing protein 15-like n=1 Tax=Branchiostoma belcheri TaxID=7741 RepID=A0A6P5A9B6_BRABE|nr:PREDICTED: leucine-rich repeat-containing protein 15-like [Branchiostoma belcheri]
MARSRTSCLLVCLLAVLTGGVTALDCAPQCRCYGTTVDCSHGVLTGFPRNQLIPSSTEVLLLDDNQLSDVSRNPPLPNLLELSLEDNSITELSRRPFVFRPNIRVLRLGGNAISDVSASDLDGLSQLVKLYLNSNSIATITAFGSDSFVDNLKMLDLQGNKLTSIGIGTFTGVSLLTELNLSSNNISAIEDGSFSHLKELRVLYLHSNHIGMLNSATFMKMSALNRLTLSDNNIQSLPDMAFIGAPNLEFLDLSSNNLSTIPQTSFSGLHNLTTLLLERNNIRSIEDGAFGDLVKLQSLVLRNNKLQNISTSTFPSMELWALDLTQNRLTAVRRDDFARLTKLKYLHLYSNSITSVEDGSFANLADLLVLEIYGNSLTNVSAATFEGLVSVEQILIGGNPIKSYPDDTFWHLPKLSQLGLIGNPLVNISDVLLSRLQGLKNLAIADTGLTSVPALPASLESLVMFRNQLTEIRPGDFTTLPRSGVFRHLPCLQTVTLGERLTCDCDLLDLVKWINKTVVNVRPTPPTCFLPRRLRERSLENLREEDLQVTCPATSVPATPEPTAQTCPTPSPPHATMTTPSQGGSLSLATHKSSKPPMSSSTTGQTVPVMCETCTSPTNVIVQNVKDSLAEVKWAHGGSKDLTGFVIQYKILTEENSLKETELVHSTRRSYPIWGLLSDTPYLACVAVSCKNKVRQPVVDDCVYFATGKTAVSVPQEAVVGLAVGVPLLLLILVMAAVIVFLKRKGRSTAEHVDERRLGQRQKQEASIGLAEVHGDITDDPPYNSINEDLDKGHQENPYQNPDFLTEPGEAGTITNPYIDFPMK